ncbi:MAG: 4-(cytidine 5'-diphospho)-2-C-methyl-D-erythritol kinase [Terracidiphilus sp.]
MSTAVRSHAKINLGLGIGAPRPDGFHALVTVYQTLELFDLVTVTARPAEATTIRITSNDGRVPVDKRNTAWKMAALALDALERRAEVEIHIEKRLPVQGGLGAGSANAVAALVGLEAELGIGAGSAGWGARRLEIAAHIGSDVPLFLIGGAVLGLDRGQQVYPLPDFEPVWCVVAAPDLGVSTPQAFRDWDALCATEGLTAAASADKLVKLSRAYASAFAESSPEAASGAIPQGWPGAGSSGVLFAEENLAGPTEFALVRTGIPSWIENDFERVVFPQYPSLGEIKRILLGSGTPEAALHASLSGSGSALFGLYRTRGDAEAAQVRLKEQPRNVNVRSRLTRTLPRRAYWRQMLLPAAG